MMSDELTMKKTLLSAAMASALALSANSGFADLTDDEQNFYEDQSTFYAVDDALQEGWNWNFMADSAIQSDTGTDTDTDTDTNTDTNTETPQNVQASLASPNTVTVTWDVLSDPHCDGFLVFYEGLDTDVDGDRGASCDVRSYTFYNLEPGRWRFSLQQIFRDGDDEWESSLSNKVIAEPYHAEMTYQYDALGRLVEVQDPVNGDRNYTFDKAGNRTNVTTN